MWLNEFVHCLLTDCG